MANSKKKTNDIINRYYDKFKVSDSIKSIKLDVDRYNQAMQQSNVYEKRQDVYDKFGIKMYNSRQEFGIAKSAVFPKGISRDKLDEMWKDYQDRDKLIISGQYEEYRYQSYRSKYIEAMKRSGLSNEVIKNVESLPMEKWKDIIILPSNKNNASEKLFPKLGGFHYGDTSEKFIHAATSEIKAAFAALGLEYKSFDNIEKKKREIISARKNFINDDLETAQVIDRIVETLPKNSKALLQEKLMQSKDVVENIIDIGIDLPKYNKNGTERIRISKSGNKYIPFVGSTRPGSKNEKIMKLIIEANELYE